jgi:uncharacterized protein
MKENKAAARFEKLVGLIRGLGPCAVAFSGGVDSSLVAAAAYQAHGKGALAVTLLSELVPATEEQDAAWVARSIGICLATVRLPLLENKSVAGNPPDRCYHCKKVVFRAISELAGRKGLGVIIDGTNAEDARSSRPGLKALAEMGVVSPLAKLRLTKADVREMAKEAGLPNFDRPSNPCLATRFPYGTPLTEAGLGRVRAAEEYVKSLGFPVLRVRDHGGLARIEVEKEMIPRLLSNGLHKKIVAKLRSLGYSYVTLDMAGFRSGSMDVHIKGESR